MDDLDSILKDIGNSAEKGPDLGTLETGIDNTPPQEQLDFYEKVQKQFQISSEEIPYYEAAAGVAAKMQGATFGETPGQKAIRDRNNQELLIQLQSEHSNFLRERNQFSEDRKKTVSNNWYDPQNIALNTVGSVPQMLSTIGAGLKYGSAGAGVGAAYGAAAGVAVAAPTGELAAPITGPAGAFLGAVAGFETGYGLGQITQMYKVFRGQEFSRLVDMGVSPDAASDLSTISGVAQAALENFGVAQLTGLGVSTLKKVLSKDVGKKAIKTFIGEYTKNVLLIEPLTEAGQQLIANLTDITTVILDDVLKTGASQEVRDAGTWNTLTKEVINNYLSAIGPSAILGGASSATGATIGAGVKVSAETMKQNINNTYFSKEGLKGFKDAFTAFYESMRSKEDRGPTEQDVADVNAADPDSILDQLSQPAGQGVSTDAMNQEEIDFFNSLGLQPGEVVLKAGIQKNAVAPTETQTVDTDVTDIPTTGLTEQDFVALANKEIPAVEYGPRRKQIDQLISAVDRRISNQEDRVLLQSEKDVYRYSELADSDETLQKLYDTRAKLETEAGLIDEGVATAKDLKGTVVLSTSRITRLRANATNKIIRSFERGVRKGAVKTKQSVRDVQTAIVSLVRSAELPLEDKGRFLATIKNIQTPEQLTKALPDIKRRINEYVEKSRAADARKRVERLLKRAKPIAGGKKPKGKFDAETQQVLDIYRAFAKDPQLRNLALQKAVDATASGTPLNEALDGEDLITAQVALQMANFENATADQLEFLGDTLTQLVADGRSNILEKKAERQAQKKQNQGVGHTSVKGNRSVREKTQKPLMEKLKRSMDSEWGQQDSFGGLMHLVSEYDPMHRLNEITDVHKAKRDEQAGNILTIAKLKFSIRDSMFKGTDAQKSKQFLKYLAGTNSTHNVASILADGSTFEDTMTKQEIIDTWMKFQDQSLRDSFREGNEYTFTGEVARGRSTEEALESLMSDEDIAFAEGLFDFYDDYFERVNNWYKGTYGISLSKVNPYSPVRRIGVDKDAMFNPLDEWKDRMSLIPGSAIARTKNTYEIKAQDALNLALDHIQKWEHTINWFDTLQNINDVLSHGDTMSLIEKRYGPKIVKIINTHFKDFIANKLYSDSHIAGNIDRFRVKLAKAKLGAKWVYSAVQQLGSIPAYWEEIPLAKVPYYTAKTVANLKGTVDNIWQSPIVQTRWSNQSREMREAYGNSALFFRKEEGVSFDDIMMYGFRLGDQAGISLGGGALYNYLVDTGVSHEAALEKVERVIEETQQSGSIDQQSALQRGGSIQRLFTNLFVSQPNQLMRKTINATRDYVNGPKDAESTKKFLKQIALFHVTMPVIQQLIALGFNVDDDNADQLLRAAILGNINGIAIFGDVAEFSVRTVWDTVYNLSNPDKPQRDLYDIKGNTLLTETAGDAIGLFNAVMKYRETQYDFSAGPEKTNEAGYEVLKATANAADSLVGLPLDAPFRIGENLKATIDNGDPSGAAMASVGWPRSTFKEKYKKQSGDFMSPSEPSDGGLVEQISRMFQNYTESKEKPYNPLESLSAPLPEDTPEPEPEDTQEPDLGSGQEDADSVRLEQEMKAADQEAEYAAKLLQLQEAER